MTPQQDFLLFDLPPSNSPDIKNVVYGESSHVFDGQTYEHQFDCERLGDQARAVWNVVKDGRWRTLSEIGDAAGVRSEASISARLRDFRKERFGSHTVNRQRRGDPSDGLFEYQVVVNGGAQ